MLDMLLRKRMWNVIAMVSCICINNYLWLPINIIGDAGNDGGATASTAENTRATDNVACRNTPISDNEERDTARMHNDQDIVIGDDLDEVLENNSDDDTISMRHKTVAIT